MAQGETKEKEGDYYDFPLDAKRNAGLLIVGQGYLGRGCVDEFLSWQSDCRIVTLSRSSAEEWKDPRVLSCRGDCRDKWLLEKIIREENIRDVLFLAGVSTVSAAEEQRDSGAVNLVQPLLECILENHWTSEIRVLFASTVHLYEAAGDTVTLCREEEHLDPNKLLGAYAAEKLREETSILEFREKYAAPVGVARLSNVYGGFDPNGERLIPTILRAIGQGRAAPVVLSVQVDEAGRSSFLNMVHIQDAARGLLLILSRLDSDDPIPIYNVAGPESQCVEEVISLVGKILHVRIEIRKVTQVGWTPIRRTYSIEKLRRLGYSPRSLELSMREEAVYRDSGKEGRRVL